MKNNILKITLIGILAAVIIVASQIMIPIGIIPITLQTLVIGVVASIFTWRISVSSVLLYLFLGAIGLPVFAGGKGGFVVFLSPTGGYLISFIVLAFLQPLLLRISKALTNQIIVNTIGQFLSLIIGSFFMMFILNVTAQKAFSVGFLPFIVPTIIKIILIVVIVEALLQNKGIKKIAQLS